MNTINQSNKKIVMSEDFVITAEKVGDNVTLTAYNRYQYTLVVLTRDEFNRLVQKFAQLNNLWAV